MRTFNPVVIALCGVLVLPFAASAQQSVGPVVVQQDAPAPALPMAVHQGSMTCDANLAPGDLPAREDLATYKVSKVASYVDVAAGITPERVEVNTASMWQMLRKQERGQAGVLHVDGLSNIFFVRGSDGNLCVIQLHWAGEGTGWVLNTYQNNNKGFLPAGTRVIAQK